MYTDRKGYVHGIDPSSVAICQIVYKTRVEYQLEIRIVFVLLCKTVFYNWLVFVTTVPMISIPPTFDQ